MHFSAHHFAAQHFAAVHLQLTAGAVAPVVTPDPYAWFPGDRGPGPPRRRYEEYATEERPTRRRRPPQRIPRAKLEPPLPLPPPLDLVAPIAPAAPLELAPIALPEASPAPSARTAAALPEVYPVPQADPNAGADWTSYAHLAVDPLEDAEELAVLAELTGGGRRRR